MVHSRRFVLETGTVLVYYITKAVITGFYLMIPSPNCQRKWKNLLKNTSHGTPVNSLHFENAGEHRSKLYIVCEKEKVALEYKAPHMLQLNVIAERIFTFIEEIVLAMLLNAKLNDTDQKMLWSEAVYTCERVQNSLATTGSMEIPF